MSGLTARILAVEEDLDDLPWGSGDFLMVLRDGAPGSRMRALGTPRLLRSLTGLGMRTSEDVEGLVLSLTQERERMVLAVTRSGETCVLVRGQGSDVVVAEQEVPARFGVHADLVALMLRLLAVRYPS